MKNLLKADLFRIKKNKLIKVLAIIAAALPLLSCLLYFGIDKLLEFLMEGDYGITLMSGQQLIRTCYSCNDFGIVAFLFAGIFVCHDMNDGMMRNKIVSGSSKTKIFLSHFITSCLVVMGLLLINFISSVIFSSLFFEYAPTYDLEVVKLTFFKDYKSWLILLLLGNLTFIYFTSLSFVYAFSSKNTAPTIIFSGLTGLGFSLILSVVSVVITGLEEKYYWVRNLLMAIPDMGLTTLNTSSPILGSSELLLLEHPVCLIISIVSTIAFTVLNCLIALSLFKKKDMK